MLRSTLRLVTLSTFGLVFAGAAMAQQSTTSKGIPGYLNPRTHTFEAKVRQAIPEATTANTYSGTYKFEIKVTLVTPVGSGEEVVCNAIADVEDYNKTTYAVYNDYEETASSVATVSGSTATCNVNIPYSWSLAYASSDIVSLDYLVTIVPTSTNSPLLEYSVRTHQGGIASLTSVPSTGSTTVIPVSATI
jgi:hypothetical protein